MNRSSTGMNRGSTGDDRDEPRTTGYNQGSTEQVLKCLNRETPEMTDNDRRGTGNNRDGTENNLDGTVAPPEPVQTPPDYGTAPFVAGGAQVELR
ncbi:hypothetical protein DPMN_073467 [Dreissena polymorpha]|uniref:Uncharacterized protein n=1 Tax=Dreissena polymorpha TaxID=45954 RepID=A0A9D4HE17_DREPO|nr:hypothetical protein DPMN_073467 [Dreissena polymorpha]